MKYEKIGISLLLAFLIAITLTGVSASDNLTDTVANENAATLTAAVSGNTVTDIQNAIDSANEGDTINLGENKEYNLYMESVTINKKITLTGKNVTLTAQSTSGAISIRGANDITIKGLTFVNPVELPDYGNRTFSGKAVYTQNAKNILIDDCKFINYAYGVEIYSTQSSSVKNSWFNGATTAVKSSETGTKAVQLMGSKNIEIINNTFYGQILDGLSIASGSGNVLIENNTFINNTYAIFYGGASTEGSKIKNNRFITCGMINTTYYNSYLKQSFNIIYQNLPVISLQKASSNIEITGNEFTVKDNNMLIISEAENTEHGYPSSVGGINITGNIVKKADENVIGSTVTFYYLNVLQSLALTPTDAIILKDNDFTDIEDINNFQLDFASIKNENNDITIPKAKTDTYLTVSYVKDGRIVIALFDINGNELTGKSITYTINGGEKQTQTTDEYGHIYINDLSGTVNINAQFHQSDDYFASELSTTVQLSVTQIQTEITAQALKVNAVSAKSTYYKFTLKDGDGNILPNQDVSITFNGKIYPLTTDSNGIASFKINTQTAGKYSVTLAFSGDGTYKGSLAVSTITISKQATKLTVAKKTFKKSATKKVTAVLKDNTGKVIKSKKLTMKVNGKTYAAKTNSKGVATFTVKITKAGTFSATTKFAGDNCYTAKSVSSKIIVK